jgi:hypothetical protein
MVNNDQMPSDGCATCGMYAEEPQHILRERLTWCVDLWLCRECAAKSRERRIKSCHSVLLYSVPPAART